jgi:hypothetical protein
VKNIHFISQTVFSGFLILIFLSGCAVVKKPYFQSDYYSETLSGLEKIAPQVKVINDSLYAGFAKRCIIPDTEILKKKHGSPVLPLAGYGKLNTKVATGIHDSVFVRAVALKTGTTTNYIVSAEMLIMPPNIIDSVILKLSKAGINRDQLFFSATHTHSGVGGWGYGILAKMMAGKRNTAIENWLEEQIIKVIYDASVDLCPALLGPDHFEAPQFIRNRLTGNPEHNNTTFDYISIQQVNGRKAILGIYPAHATNTSGKNRLISGDYPGYWSRKIENSSGELAIFCGGSMGGQSPAGEGNEFESARFIGESLADSVMERSKKIKLHRSSSISSVSLNVILPEYHFRVSANRNLSTAMSQRLMPAPSNVYLQALKLDNTIWFFTPGDFSGESAIMLRRLITGKGYNSIVTGYNGGYVGYILPGKYFYLDHYEPRMMGWFGPTFGEYIFEMMDRMSQILMK